MSELLFFLVMYAAFGLLYLSAVVVPKSLVPNHWLDFVAFFIIWSIWPLSAVMEYVAYHRRLARRERHLRSLNGH